MRLAFACVAFFGTVLTVSSLALLYAPPIGLSLERTPAAANQRLVQGRWSDSRRGGCANSDGWRSNPHYRLRFAGSNAAGPLRVSVLLAPDATLAQRGTGFYATTKPPSQCTVKDILRLADVKFVVGERVAMSFDLRRGNNDNNDVDFYVVPCTFEPNVDGEFSIILRATQPFDVVETNATA